MGHDQGFITPRLAVWQGCGAQKKEVKMHDRQFRIWAAAFIVLILFGAGSPAGAIEPPAIDPMDSDAFTWTDDTGTRVAAEAKVYDHHFTGDWRDYDIQMRLPNLT